MADNSTLRTIYTFFLGLLIAVFVGVGISAFYQAPKFPEYPGDAISYDKEPSPEQITKQKQYDEEAKRHSEQMKDYSRNVSVATMAAAIVFLIVSLAFEKRIRMIADGILLGGVFTLIYSIGRSFSAGDQKYTFVVVSVGLAVTLYLGYHRFLRIKK